MLLLNSNRRKTTTIETLGMNVNELLCTSNGSHQVTYRPYDVTSRKNIVNIVPKNNMQIKMYEWSGQGSAREKSSRKKKRNALIPYFKSPLSMLCISLKLFIQETKQFSSRSCCANAGYICISIPLKILVCFSFIFGWIFILLSIKLKSS